MRVAHKAHIKMLGEMEQERKKLVKRLRIVEEDAKRMALIIKASKIAHDMKEKLEEYASLEVCHSTEDVKELLGKRIDGPLEDL